MTISAGVRSRARPLVTTVCLLGLVGCGGAEDGPERTLALSSSDVQELSDRFAATVGDALDEPVEARLVGNGDHVVVLDGRSPHLRLFTVAGEWVWTGGVEEEEPAGLDEPRALAATGSEITVVQRGRLTRWTLEGDSLAFASASSLPFSYRRPLGVEYGCEQEPLLYGMSRGELHAAHASDTAPSVESLDWLHAVRSPEGAEGEMEGEDAEEEAGAASAALQLEGLWSEPRMSTVARVQHRGALLDASPEVEGLVLWHRPDPGAAGRIVEFGCPVAPERSHREAELVTGESVAARSPRPEPVGWTNGVLALPGGFLVAIPRYTPPEEEDPEASTPAVEGWRTELFRFRDGTLETSVLVSGQWFLMDFHPSAGAVMVADQPRPHFIVVPVRGGPS